MKFFLILVLFYLTTAQHSVSDKCYVQYSDQFTNRLVGYQYYIDRKGVPVTRDWVVYEYVPKTNNTQLSRAYYYHYDLDCNTKKDDKYTCTSNCTSVWFKYLDEKSNSKLVEQCGTHFFKKYRNVMEYPCTMGNQDYFRYVKAEIGKVSTVSIKMEGKKPALMKNYYEGEKCDTDYNILGLWTVIIVLIVSCVVVFLLFVIVIWVIAQKSRKEKRARLQSSLIEHEASV